MSSLALERVLRAVAIAVAIAAAIDPAQTKPGTPRVAVVAHDPRDEHLAADVRAALASRFAVTPIPDPTAAAWVAVSPQPDRDPAAAWPRHLPVSAVVAARPTMVTFEEIAAPRRVHATSRALINATLRGQGSQHTSSTVVLRFGSLELGRQTVHWSGQDGRAQVQFDPLLPAPGPNHLTLAIEGTTAARADLVISSTDDRTAVLIVETRPSWATTFIRRGLERDRRFEVGAVTRLSTGVATGRAAPDFARARLERYAVIIVGGPEELSNTEVDRLRRFSEERGGSLVFALDRMPAGPVLSLLPAGPFAEKMLASPATVSVGGHRLEAREWALARGLKPGATSSDATSGASTLGAGLVSRPLGSGQVTLVGALDAWRFREREDRRFDRAWTDLVARLGAEVAPRLAVGLDRDVIRPGESVIVRADLSLDATGDAGGTARDLQVRATLSKGSDAATPIRLWPEGGIQRFAGRLSGPLQEGVYAVSVHAASGLTSGNDGAEIVEVPLVVSAGARAVEPPTGWLQAVVESSGGVVVHTGQLARLSEHLARTLASRDTRAVWHPMRAPWWLAVFAACLGGEWWLRRRAGRR